MSLRDEILNKKPPTQGVIIPQWNCTLYLRPMSAKDKLSLLKGIDAMDNLTFQCAVIARCLVDEAGVRVFADEDTEALMQKEVSVLEQLYSLIDEQSKTLKDTLKKN